MNKRIYFICTIFVLLFSPVISAASLVNGDFETGDLEGWATFTNPGGETSSTTPGSTVDVYLFDTNGDGLESLAPRFTVGGAGGGISQSFILSNDSVLDIALDVAVFGPGNVACNCNTNLIIDGTILDNFFVSGTSVAEPLRRDTLSFSGPFSAGTHTLTIEMDRGGGATNAQRHFVDNIVVVDSVPQRVPISPIALAILAPVISGFAAREIHSPNK